MRLLAAITVPSVARQILECLALPPRAPPLASARELEVGSVVGCDDPGFDFDQSPSEAF